MTSASCVRDCAGRRPRAGPLLRLRSRTVDAVDAIAFLGRPDLLDDVAVPPVKLRSRSLDVRVPRAAVSGPVVAVTIDAVRSAPLRKPLARAAASPAGSGPSIDVEVTEQRLFYGAHRAAQLIYVVHRASPAFVVVEVVQTTDAVTETSWDGARGAGRDTQTVMWDAHRDRRPAARGCYYPRITARTKQARRPSRARSPRLRPPPTRRHVRAPRPHLPDPRPEPLRRRRGAIPRLTWAPRTGHLRRLRDVARGGAPRVVGSPAITAAPATTS